MKPYYVTFVRPVGSKTWTPERLAPTPDAADRQAIEERNRKVRFADGSLHLQSTAIVLVELPEEPDTTQQHHEAVRSATVRLGIP